MILLVGLPNLNTILKQTVIEPFRQRIVMNYNLEVVNKIDAKEYILYKLSKAGCQQSVFDEQAIEDIINTCNGTPRFINRLCDTALALGNSKNINIIDSEVIS